MPHLGFERFLSLDELGGLERFGPYVSDRALGEEALSLLRQSRLPVFCFVITMEAHGPWLPGRLDEGQIARTLPDLDLSLFDAPLRLYLCHLRHMDELIGMFRKENKESIASAATRQSIVCAYGDHAPSLHFNL